MTECTQDSLVFHQLGRRQIMARFDAGIVELSLDAAAPRRILHIALVRDGETIARFPGTGKRSMRVRHTDKDLPTGTHWYYWTVQQEGEAPPFAGNAKVARGPLAWSSPHWVNVSSQKAP